MSMDVYKSPISLIFIRNNSESYISAWASALLVLLWWAMRRPPSVGRVTSTDSHAFFVYDTTKLLNKILLGVRIITQLSIWIKFCISFYHYLSIILALLQLVVVRILFFILFSLLSFVDLLTISVAILFIGRNIRKILIRYYENIVMTIFYLSCVN